MAVNPKDWKDAAGGEEQISYVLYDVNASTTTGSTTLTFFNNTEAGQSLDVTNMQIAGQLPASHRFLLKEIRANFDPESATNDIKDLTDRATIEIVVNNKRMFTAPLLEVMSPNAFLPQGATETISHQSAIGFALDRYLAVPGSTPFKVVVVTGDTAASASQDIYVVLLGDLVRPSA